MLESKKHRIVALASVLVVLILLGVFKQLPLGTLSAIGLMMVITFIPSMLGDKYNPQWPFKRKEEKPNH
jgi:hypothetical protein